MSKTASIQKECSHCHQPCDDAILSENEKDVFCCFGCKVVYELLDNDEKNDTIFLDEDLVNSYKYLNHPQIKQKFLDFQDGSIEKVNVLLPQIHCSSCIFLLENLTDLNDGILQVKVAFARKKVEILYQSDRISLAQLAALLSHIGYKPDFSSLSEKPNNKRKKHKLLYQMGVAGFFFGNTMLLALPEYLHSNISTNQSIIRFFHFLMMAFSLPVLIYSAKDYFVNSYKSLRAGILSIDLPIAIGVGTLFIRSVYEIISHTGSGYFDSLCGLIFFLLLGKWYQQKTYENFSFDRDYRSFLPLAASLLTKKGETTIPVDNLKKGDIILVRTGEIIPGDGKLLSKSTQIDYSYITGESVPVEKIENDNLYAGGRVQGKFAEVEISAETDKSYLSSLWEKDSFKTKKKTESSFTDKISQYFTPAILSIALLGAMAWSFFDSSKSILVFTAVLIVACPCALALAEPFASGSTMRWFGRFGFYLKNASVLNELIQIDQVVFDKTGTLTEQENVQLKWNGPVLETENLEALYSGARIAQHPLARSLQQSLGNGKINKIEITNFKEYPGEGIEFTTSIGQFAVGKASFIGCENVHNGTAIYISKNDKPLGSFSFYHKTRRLLPKLINSLKRNYQLAILSGDNDQEKERFNQLFGKNASLHFNQSPVEKLDFIQSQRVLGLKTLMIGDGLNDAGALRQSEVGISLCEENVNFFPASDALLKASSFNLLPLFLKLSKTNASIIKKAFTISLIYNLLGLGFALSGILSPLVCAILMPLSSATVVIYTTIATRNNCIKHLKNNALNS